MRIYPENSDEFMKDFVG